MPDTEPQIETWETMYENAFLKGLSQIPTIFHQGDRLMEVVRRPDACVIPVTRGSLRVHMSRSTTWTNRVHQANGINLPPDMNNRILSRGYWPDVRPIAGVTTTPVLRRDGTLLTEAGYDDATRLFHEPAGTFDVPAAPTRQDATAALALLKRQFAPIPFATEEHRSAYFAALLTPFARPSFDGAAPLFLFDAPSDRVPAMLADAISRLVQGDQIIRAEKPDSERGFRRMLAKAQLQGDHLILLKGAESFRSTDALETALFAQGWIDGRERRSDPRPVTWFASTANALLSEPVSNLLLPIRLSATEDEITGQSWVPSGEFEEGLIRDRPKLVSAALTILRAFEVAGQPKQTQIDFAGFEAWSHRIAGALMWAGAPNPLDARSSARISIDDTTPDLRRFFNAFAEAVPSRRGISIPKLLELAKTSEGEELRDSLELLLGEKWKHPRILGAFFKKHNGRTFVGQQFYNAGEDGNGYARWAIRPRPESSESQPANDDKERLGPPPPPCRIEPLLPQPSTAARPPPPPAAPAPPSQALSGLSVVSPVIPERNGDQLKAKLPPPQKAAISEKRPVPGPGSGLGAIRKPAP